MWRFSDPEMEEFYQRFGVCPIFLLVDDEERVCECTDCQHHVFYEEIPWANINTEHTRLMRNCVTFGVLNVGELVLEDIAAIYDIARERVRQIIEKILFGRKGIGKKIKNVAFLRNEFNITPKEISHFDREHEGWLAKEKAKNTYTLKLKALKRREQGCRTRSSRNNSGQIPRLNP